MIALDGTMETLSIDNYVNNHKFLVNSYKCESCQFAISTVDQHVGLTPSKILCLSASNCKGEMVTRGYQPRSHKDHWPHQLE